MRCLAAGSVVAVFVVGCSSPAMHNDLMDYVPRETQTSESLFDTDRQSLQTESIEKILGATVRVPRPARLAVLRFGRDRPWISYSKDVTQLTQDVQKDFVKKLQQCKRLSKASLLPSLMTPKRQSFPHLREAAARYQADLLLVYRSTSRVYAKQKFLRPDEVKAQCVVEAILLDVRTGLVPFTSVSVQAFTTQEAKSDFEYLETRDRAELEAVAKGLATIAAETVKFVETLPERPAGPTSQSARKP